VNEDGMVRTKVRGTRMYNGDVILAHLTLMTYNINEDKSKQTYQYTQAKCFANETSHRTRNERKKGRKKGTRKTYTTHSRYSGDEQESPNGTKYELPFSGLHIDPKSTQSSHPDRVWG
jgi:ribosomal protein L4